MGSHGGALNDKRCCCHCQCTQPCSDSKSGQLQQQEGQQLFFDLLLHSLNAPWRPCPQNKRTCSHLSRPGLHPVSTAVDTPPTHTHTKLQRSPLLNPSDTISGFRVEVHLDQVVVAVGILHIVPLARRVGVDISKLPGTQVAIFVPTAKCRNCVGYLQQSAENELPTQAVALCVVLLCGVFVRPC